MRKQHYASTRDGVKAIQATQVFYTAPATIARILCLLLLVLYTTMFVLYTAMFSLMSVAEAMAILPSLLPLLALGFLGQVGLAFLLSRLSPIRMDDSAITLTDCWGRKRSLRWDEIESATPGRCLFVKYLKVAPARHHPVGTLIIPMTVTRPEAFRDAIGHYAEPENPVRRFLEEGLYEGLSR